MWSEKKLIKRIERLELEKKVIIDELVTNIENNTVYSEKLHIEAIKKQTIITVLKDVLNYN